MAYEDVCKQKYLYEGELTPCMAGDHEIVIMWPDGGKPKAYEALCPHGAITLGPGDFNGRILHCRAHGWVFDGHTGEGLKPTGCALKEYPMRIENGMVQVDIAGELRCSQPINF